MTVCFLVTCAYVFDVGVHTFSSTARRACGYDMLEEAFSAQISFSFLQMGHWVDETV